MLTDIEYYTLRRRLALRKVAGFAACRPYRYYIRFYLRWRENPQDDIYLSAFLQRCEKIT